jgi:hypothetical protein
MEQGRFPREFFAIISSPRFESGRLYVPNFEGNSGGVCRRDRQGMIFILFAGYSGGISAVTLFRHKTAG